MAVFTSRRERRLWTWAAIVVVATYSTLGLANSLADTLSASGLVDVLWIGGLLVMVGVVGTLVVRTRSGGLGVVILIGVATAYFMVLVRMASPVERSHLFEYSLVGVLIYLALYERRRNNATTRSPALLAVVSTALLGLLDEAIQELLPDRVYDIRDVGFNALAGFMAVSAAAGLNWVRRPRSD